MLPHSATMGWRGGGGGEGGRMGRGAILSPALAMSSARQVGMGGGGVTLPLAMSCTCR